ncbi:MAG: class IV adenylate cyclase [Candidatus Kerfeldbacteria bacterium]|nr:class IV adenylate cyclase [Candidatus Kerfeldbacteria bacterium]
MAVVQYDHMVEVERKYELTRVKPQVLRYRLRQLKAKRLGTVRQVDTYYSPPHRTFLGRPLYLRLRETVKGRVKHAQFEYHVAYAHFAAREHEVPVADARVLKYILKSLGFVRELQVKKRRETWKSGGVQVELDQVTGLGSFIELEVMGRGQRAALRLITPLARKLGLMESQRSPGYFKLLLQRQRPAAWRKYYDKKLKIKNQNVMPTADHPQGEKMIINNTSH